MNNFKTALSQAGIVTRVTALWAFSEAFLGGILHGFRVPFAGLVLSLVAAICMTVIAANENTKAAILKATLVVLAVKFVLSPHTPPMAYVAVLLEGLAGELFLARRKALRTGVFFLSLFCLLYSAFQHLLVLTIIFGKDFWNALDIFLNGITKTFFKQSQHYSLYLVLLYIGCHFAAGIAGGFFCSGLIKKIRSGYRPPVIEEFASTARKNENINTLEKNGNKTRLPVQYIITAVLFLLLLLSYTPLFSGTLLQSKAGEVLLRGSLIMLVWNFLLAPLLIRVMAKWVEKYKTKKANAFGEILALLPGIKLIVQFSWEKAEATGKCKRLKHFLSNTVMLIVYG